MELLYGEGRLYLGVLYYMHRTHPMHSSQDYFVSSCVRDTMLYRPLRMASLVTAKSGITGQSAPPLHMWKPLAL